MAKRLDYIDKAKGILIILVVIGHIWQSGPVFNVIYSFHMPAFFLISGMLMRHTYSYEKPFEEFLKSKLFSFGIPFVFIEILGCLTDIIRHGVTLNLKGYLFNTFSFQFNDPNLWFLMDLFLIEILFCFLIKVVNKKKYILMAIILLLYVISRFLPTGIRYISTIRGVLYYDLFFMFGFCGASYLLKYNVFICIASITAVLCVGLALERSDINTLTLKGLAFLISGLCGAYAVIQAGKITLTKKADRILSMIGMNSIIIFGTHHIIYAAIAVLLGVTDFSSTPIWFGLIMLFGVAILEIPIIYTINHWVPWLAGKQKRKIS